MYIYIYAYGLGLLVLFKKRFFFQIVPQRDQGPCFPVLYAYVACFLSRELLAMLRLVLLLPGTSIRTSIGTISTSTTCY